MSEVFAITAASSQVRLDKQGSGMAVFTVANISGRPVRGRAQVVAGEGAEQSWMALAENVEQEFTLDEKGVRQITVKIRIPPATPEGTHSVRLDMVDVANPDENYAEGPPVLFKVPDLAEKKKPFPWWIALAAAAALIVAVVVVAWPESRGQLVPNVEGRPVHEASSLLEGLGLQVARTEAPAEDEMVDKVVSQEPRGGLDLPEDRVVTISVGVKSARVPGVQGKLITAALMELQDAGLNSRIDLERTGSAPQGQVLKQTVKPNELVRVDTTVIGLVVAERPLKPNVSSGSSVPKYKFNSVSAMINASPELKLLTSKPRIVAPPKEQ